jgi:hypothetical protein
MEPKQPNEGSFYEVQFQRACEKKKSEETANGSHHLPFAASTY